MSQASETGSRPALPHGVELLHDPSLNKGTAFTARERDALGLHGLLPPRVHSIEEQVMRVLENFRAKETPIERYIDVMALQTRNETLFYRLLIEHLEEIMPVVYTPTVGEACQRYGHIFQRPRGMYVASEHRGNVREVLENWPTRDVRVVVVTDGERILGLGDLGADGMGIPVGKLALYTACAGVPPSQCLPVSLDVGTDNEELLDDPLYIGTRHPRLRGEAYDAFFDEFMEAVAAVFPRAVVQLEDFANRNAFRLLQRYRDQACVFDDDIQGTGAVALAGLYAAPRIHGLPFRDLKVLFLGAGEAGIGIGDMVCGALRNEGLDEAEARARCWFFDSRGLVVAGRDDLAEHKRPYAHEYPVVTDLVSAIEHLRPNALIGVSGQPATFTREVLRAMAEINERPVVFALSNPTSKSECTAAQAYRWTDGRAVFASGSPFEPVVHGAQTFHPGQGNNAYIFPGVGLGLLVAEATRVTDEMFDAAARALAEQVQESDLELGRLYPPLSEVREVSAHIGAAVARIAWDDGLARAPRPDDILAEVRARMYQPVYADYL